MEVLEYWELVVFVLVAVLDFYKAILFKILVHFWFVFLVEFGCEFGEFFEEFFFGSGHAYAVAF